VGAGVPVATTVNVALEPWFTVWDAGWVVMAGATSTVSVAGLLVAEPTLFVTVTV
jgi:hypothetical protein